MSTLNLSTPLVHRSYLYSFYVSVSAFTGMGDQDFYPVSIPEALVMTIYLLFNVVLNAYILGTITMLVVKGDERSKAFRDRIANLKEFSLLNDLPDVSVV